MRMSACESLYEDSHRCCKDRQQHLVATAGCHSMMLPAASHVPVGILVRLPRPSLMLSSCWPPLPVSTPPPIAVIRTPAGGGCFQPVCAATLAALRAASFVFVLVVDSVLFFVQESAGVHGFSGIDVFKDAVLAWAIVAQCVEVVLTICWYCGSCQGLVALCSRCNAFAGVLTLLEGDFCVMDGMLACAFVAQWLEGVLTILCGCGSCNGLCALISSCSAFAGDFSVLEAVSEFACIPLTLISGGLCFSRH